MKIGHCIPVIGALLLAGSCDRDRVSSPESPARRIACANVHVFDQRPGAAGKARFDAMVTWNAALDDCEGNAIVTRPESIRLTVDGEAVPSKRFHVVERNVRPVSDTPAVAHRGVEQLRRPVFFIAYCPNKPSGSINTVFTDPAGVPLAGAMFQYTLGSIGGDCDPGQFVEGGSE